MKTRPAFIALACVLCAVSAFAQPLPQADRDAAVTHLEQTRDAFLKSIAGLSDAQWTFKAAPDRWSVAEIAEHIAISESVILQLITEKILKAPALPPNTATMPTEKMLELLADRSEKFKAPEMLQPATRWATREALVKDFTAARDRTVQYVKTTTDALHAHGGPHPVFKMLDAYQWLLLLSGHSSRHTAQIEEVKAGTGYPAK